MISRDHTCSPPVANFSHPLFTDRSRLEWRQPVGVETMEKNLAPQKLTHDSFEPFYASFEVDAIFQSPTTQGFGAIFSPSLLTTQHLKSYLDCRLTQQHLENQIYQCFQLRAVPINMNPY